jgi:putative inorganic carbon (hco3(-)) transporter
MLASATASSVPRNGYWSLAWLAAVISLALLMVRVGEFLGPLQVLKPVFTVTLAILAIHAVRTSSAVWRSLWSLVQFRLAVAYAICIVASIPFSIWRGQSIVILMTVPWALALVVILGLNAPRQREFDRVLTCASWVTALTAVAAVLQGAVVEGSRITTLGSYDPNDLGALYALMLPIALGSMRRGGMLPRAISGIAALLLLAILLKTGSRGGFLALLSGTVVLVCSFRPRQIAVALVIGAVSFPAAWTLAPPLMRERAASLLALEDDYNTTSNSGRIYLWKRGVVFALSNPVVGLGAGTFEAQVGADFRERGDRGAWHTAHNTYVQVFAETGLAGGVVLITLLLRAAMLATRFWSWRNRIHRPELLAAVAAYITAITFLSHGYTYILWGVIGFSVMTERLLKAGPSGSGRSLSRHTWRISAEDRADPKRRASQPAPKPVLAFPAG